MKFVSKVFVIAYISIIVLISGYSFIYVFDSIKNMTKSLDSLKSQVYDRYRE